jgi:hypothetical protein
LFKNPAALQREVFPLQWHSGRDTLVFMFKDFMWGNNPLDGINIINVLQLWQGPLPPIKIRDPASARKVSASILTKITARNPGDGYFIRVTGRTKGGDLWVTECCS